MAQHEKLVIIGSGPAGYTAALYAARANLVPLLFEGLQPGGQLTITSDVENYPGFPEGVLGPELMEKMKKQAERFGTRFGMGDGTRVDLSSRRVREVAGAGEREAVPRQGRLRLRDLRRLLLPGPGRRRRGRRRHRRRGGDLPHQVRVAG